MIACPFCKADLPGRGFCPNCTLAVDVDPRGAPFAYLPPVERGSLLDHWDFSREPFPTSRARDEDEVAGVRDGLQVTLDRGTRMLPAFMSRTRDGCATLEATAQSGSIHLGVALRHDTVGEARTMYAFWVSPGRRLAQLVRRFATPGGKQGNANIEIAERELSRAQTSHGRKHQVELRARGATLHGLLDGSLLVSAHDPYLGAGVPTVYLQVEPDEKPGVAVCHSLALHEVKA